MDNIISKIKIGNTVYSIIDESKVSAIKIGDGSLIYPASGVVTLPEYPSTVYENKPASLNGQDVSLVTTGEKYYWNQKQDSLVSGTTIKTINNQTLLGSGNITISSGEDGKSAYEIAVIEGFSGTQEQWINSLKGADGKDGKDGKDGVVDYSVLNGYTTTQDYNTLLNRLIALEIKVAGYHPEGGDTPVGTGIAYALYTSKPTAATLSSDLDSSAEKPTGPQPLTTPQLTKPTLLYLIYPVDWEVVQNNQLVKPVILDSNGWEQGAFYDEDTPTITVNGKVYRVLNIELGVDNYTIEF